MKSNHGEQAMGKKLRYVQINKKGIHIGERSSNKGYDY